MKENSNSQQAEKLENNITEMNTTQNTIKNSNEPLETKDTITIYTTDEINKSDGTVVIGDIIDNQYLYKETILPEAIDVNQRIIEKRRNANTTKKKKKRLYTEEQKKANTITSLIAICVIAIIAGVIYYYTHRTTEKDFVLKEVSVELGEPVPTTITNYITWKNVDEMSYKLDISKVDSQKVGEYEYSITHANVTKTGKIVVKDTKAPEVKLKNITIELNGTYTPESFVESCKDLSNCNYKFSEGENTVHATVEGEKEVFIVIVDDYGNSELLKAKVTVVSSNLQTLSCTRSTTSNLYKSDMELNFTFDDYSKLVSAKRKTVNTYFNIEAYNEYKKEFGTDPNHVFDDANSRYTKTNDFAANGLTDKTAIDDYYSKLGYVCN